MIDGTERLLAAGSTVGLSGLTAFLAQATPAAIADNAWERLGVAAIVVAGSAYVVKYFMDVVSRKDQELAKAHADHLAALAQELKTSNETRARLATSLDGQTAAMMRIARTMRAIDRRGRRAPFSETE